MWNVIVLRNKLVFWNLKKKEKCRKWFFFSKSYIFEGMEPTSILHNAFQRILSPDHIVMTWHVFRGAKGSSFWRPLSMQLHSFQRISSTFSQGFLNAALLKTRFLSHKSKFEFTQASSKSTGPAIWSVSAALAIFTVGLSFWSFLAEPESKINK